MKKIGLLIMVVLFIGVSGAFAQKVVFKLVDKKACTDNYNSYNFKIYKDGSYEKKVTVSLGTDGYWYTGCAGYAASNMVSNSKNVSADKAVDLIWRKEYGESASSVSIDWEED